MKGLKVVTDGFININNLQMLYRSVINDNEEVSQVVKNLFIFILVCLFKINSQFRYLISMTYEHLWSIIKD